MSDLSGCQSLLQLCSCRSNSALQVSCTGYCSVSSHCLADIVEGACLFISMLLSLFFALSFLMLVLSLFLLPLFTALCHHIAWQISLSLHFCLFSCCCRCFCSCFFDASAVAVPVASVVFVVVDAGTGAVLLLLLYCFSNLGFSCLHLGLGDYLVHCSVRRICCTMYEFFASLIDTLSQPGCVFAHRCVISQL